MNDDEKTKEELIGELQTLRKILDAAERDLAQRDSSDDVLQERQRVERELSQQEDRLRLIVEGVREREDIRAT